MVLVSCCCCCFDAVKSQTSHDGSTVELSYPFIPLSMTLSVVEAAQHSTVVSVEIEDDINFISRFLSNLGQTLPGGEIITWPCFFTHVILALFFISFGIYMCTYIPGIFLEKM